MPFDHVQGEVNPPIAHDVPVNPLSRSDIPPEMRLWEKMDVFFCSAHRPEAQDCLRSILYPPAGTFRNNVVNRFQQLRDLAYPAFRENIQAGRHGGNHFCILDKNSQEILSATIDDASEYTVACEEYRVSCALRAPPQTAEEYKAIWDEWAENSTTGDHINRHEIADHMYRNMTDNTTDLTLSGYNVEILPDYLPPSTENLIVDMRQLIRLPPLPARLTTLEIKGTLLTSLPELPANLKILDIYETELTRLSELPNSLTELYISAFGLDSLPQLPASLTKLGIIGTLVTSLPVLPNSLTQLSITEIGLDSLPQLPANLKELVVNDTELTSLPVLPASLTELSIEETPLTRLPVLPASLTKLDIEETPLTRLPVLPASLTELNIKETPLTRLRELPASLTKLNIEETPLTRLPVLPASLTELNIKETPLTRLRELPASLTKLVIIGTSLTSLPVLPASLTELSIEETPLTSLPVLPANLTKLVIIGTSLTSLPVLPNSLTQLSITEIGLDSLPQLPANLKELVVNDTELTSLPVLPASLTELSIEETPLTSLPVLPASLTKLNIKETPLTSLPVLPTSLTTLYINGAELTSLPESIVCLPATAEVGLHALSLSNRTMEVLRNLTRAPGYAGPRIAFDMADSSAPQETRALHLATADWLTPARVAEGWKAFERENDAASFSLFLDRLKDTENVRINTGFKAQISDWLTQLAEDDDLRAKTFATAQSSASSCEDRVTLALNHMQTVKQIHDVEKGDFDEDLPGLVSVAREMFRLEKLEQIARDKVKTLYFVDEIEVYLGYQNMLRVPLELTTTTREMRFFDVSHIKESDLQTAEVQVKAAEDRQFGEWMPQWSPWQSMLKRTKLTSWETLYEKKKQDYKDAYQRLSATELEPAGLLGNTDAERTVGAMAMEFAEKEFQKGLASETKVLLGGLLDAKWSTF